MVVYCLPANKQKHQEQFIPAIPLWGLLFGPGTGETWHNSWPTVLLQTETQQHKIVEPRWQPRSVALVSNLTRAKTRRWWEVEGIRGLPQK